jgi:hypothetical protein
MKANHLSERQVFIQFILPKLKKDFPESSIMDFIKTGDEFKVGIYVDGDNKKSRVIQHWMIVNGEAIFVSTN